MKKVSIRALLPALRFPLSIGFTLVELLVVIAILAVLSGAAYIGIQRSQARVMNEKMIEDLQAIANAMEQYKQDNNGYPLPFDPNTGEPNDNQNVNCFYSDTAYAHDCSIAAFAQAMVDNSLLTKRYLQEVPTDPRTGSRYVYGVSTDGNFFQVAGLYLDNEGNWTARVVGDVQKGYSLPSLIRAYNGPNFVINKKSYLPYSPDHQSINATLDEVSGSVMVEGMNASNGTVVTPGQTIKVEVGGNAVLYFSDGSVTYLDAETEVVELRLLPNSEVQQNDADGIITKIKLKLFQGKIWNKVARLAEKSEFNVETTSAIAGVRGTEFGIDSAGTQLVVLSGEIATRQISPSDDIITDLDGTTYVIFDNTERTFQTDQVITGDGTFQAYTPPVHDTAVGTGQPVSETQYIEKYYTLPVNNIVPRVLEIDVSNSIATFTLPEADPNNTLAVLPTVNEIYVIAADGTEDDVGKWDDLNINTDDKQIEVINPDFDTIIDNLESDHNTNQALFIYSYNIDGDEYFSQYSEVAVPIASGVLLAENDIYGQPVAVAQEEEEEQPDGGGTPTGGTNFTVNNPKTYYETGAQVIVHLEIDGDPFIGASLAMSPTGLGATTDMSGNAMFYLPTTAGQYTISANSVPGVTPIDLTVCEYVGDTGSECWILSEDAGNCGNGDNGACDEIGLICDTSDWNDCGPNNTCGDPSADTDDSFVCKQPGFAGPSTISTSSSNNYAPYLYTAYDRCYYRLPSVTYIPPANLCNVSAGAGKQRFCKCQ